MPTIVLFTFGVLELIAEKVKDHHLSLHRKVRRNRANNAVSCATVGTMTDSLPLLCRLLQASASLHGTTYHPL